MKRRSVIGAQAPLIASLLAATMAMSLVSTASAQGDVVSLQGSQPKASEIIEGFKGGVDDGLPEGMLPDEIAGSVRTRGIRIGGASAAPPPSDDGGGQVASASSSASSSSSGCPLDRAVAITVNFGYNSFELRPGADEVLSEVAAAMRSDDLSACAFAVEGHTDSSGADDYNYWLSTKRADTVKRFLVGAHVDAGRLRTVGKGESEPLDAGNPESPMNRRVQFRIVGESG